MSLNLASIVSYSARYHADATALIHDEAQLTFTDVDAYVQAFAAHLRAQGVEQGDKVALLMPNSRSFTLAYFGILHAGATVVPISFLSVEREITYALDDSDARALVAWAALGDHIRTGHAAAQDCRTLIAIDESDGPLTVVDGPPIELAVRCDIAATAPTDTAVILYTSGTTGQPKGAELTHFNMYSNAQISNERLLSTREQSVRLGPGDVVLSVLPLFHSFGQTCNQNSGMLGAAALTYMQRFDAEQALSVMERDRVTTFSGVPTMYFQLLNYPDADKYDLSSLKYCFSGGAAMPVDVMHAFEDKFGVKVLEGYGLSETSPVATFSVLDKPYKPGSIGEPIYGCDMKIVDADDRDLPPDEVGEIVIRGYNVMKGYYKRPEATAEVMRGGWFHTGDLGRMDEDGYFYVVDRKKDMIIRGGFNVYPREVEEVLYAHPAVNEAAVIGVPSDEYGEEVKAFVALKGDVTEEELLAYCKANLAATKYPRLYEIRDELPKGSTGKILRKALR